MGAYGSLTGGAVVAYYLGNEEQRNKLLFVAPFLIIGIIGVYKALGEEVGEGRDYRR